MVVILSKTKQKIRYNGNARNILPFAYERPTSTTQTEWSKTWNLIF